MSEAIWFPVLTLILGFVAGAIADVLRDGRLGKRERLARLDQRNETLRLRRNDFQRANLLDLQEATALLARMAGATHYHDTMSYRATGEWRQVAAPAELDEGFMTSIRRVGLLRVRITDDEARDLIEQVQANCTGVVSARSPEESDAQIRAMAGVLNRAQERIGVVLRALDRDEEELAASR